MTRDLTLDPWSGEWTDRVVTQRDRQLALWSAVDKGDLTTVRGMLDHGIDVNTTDMHGNLVLHSAVIWQSSEVVKELIDAGSEVNKQNDNGQTPLHLAADKGKAYTVLQLLEGGTHADIKTKYSEMTALHLAAKSGHHSVVRLLLDHGSNPNTRDCIGKIPEFYAANILTKKEFEDCRKQNRQPTKGDNKTGSTPGFITEREHGLSVHSNHRQPAPTEDHTGQTASTISSHQGVTHSMIQPSNLKDTKGDSVQTNKDTKGHSVQLDRDTKGHSVQTNMDTKSHSVQPKRDLKGHSVPPSKNIKGHSVQPNRDTKDHSVHFVKDPHKNDPEAIRNKKVINSRKDTSSTNNINLKLEFSQEHKARMATNVFDRLAGKKK